MEIDAIEAAVSRTDLILRSHGLSDQILLHVNSVRSKAVLVTHLIFECIEAKKKADCEGRTGAKARARRKIGDVMNLDALFHAHETQALAHRGMLNVSVDTHILDARIGNAAVIVEE